MDFFGFDNRVGIGKIAHQALAQATNPPEYGHEPTRPEGKRFQKAWLNYQESNAGFGVQPRLDAEPGVRFLVVQPGFLEPLTFGPGRFVTVLGRVGGLRERLVGDFTYTYPVIEAEEIHLWPANPELWSNRTRWNFGIGIQL